ncbi:MAG: hypothetical protein M3Q44_06435 [bacterium]|nr:hypothetical protein [bacterium]
MKKLLLIIFSFAFLALFIKIGWESQAKSASCGANCSLKEIGSINPIGGNFIPTTTLELNKSYWVRLTINGQDTVTPPSSSPIPTSPPSAPGADIMLVIDSSSSMADTIDKSSVDPTQIIRYTAAANALKWFIDNAKTNDYMGFSSFRYCRDYATSPVRVKWVYEDYSKSGDGKYRGFGALHFPLQSISGQQNTLKGIFNNITFSSGGDVNFCSSFGDSNGGGTSIGAGISVADTQLTPILSGNPKRSDNTPYSKSTWGVNGVNAGNVSRAGAKKYMILASDGGEGVPPYAMTSAEIDGSGRTIVQRAADNGVKIYTISFSNPTNQNSNYLRTIANATGGKSYSGESEKEIMDSLQAIRTDITATGGSSNPSPNPGGVTDSIVKVNEKINVTNFKIDEPVYNTNPTIGTFKITKGSASGEIEGTSSICPSLNCITSKVYSGGNLNSFSVTLDPLKYGDTRYVYFRVTTKASSTGLIPVDDNSSTLNYVDLPATVAIDNVSVVINNPRPFFQTFAGGDVYSGSNSLNSSIFSQLRQSTDYFATAGDSVVIHRGGANYGNGTASIKNRELRNYSLSYDPLQQSYNSLYESYLNLIPPENIKNISGIDDFTNSGYYIDSTSQNNVKYTIKGSGWSGKNISGKKIVFFIPGDLYIDADFSVQEDGLSIIIFIVKGRIGIDPSVNFIQGVFIADGMIDTACNSTSSFNSSNDCSPSLGGSLTSNQLTIEGVVFSNSVDSSGIYNPSKGGFSLDRSPISTTIPGERFVFRPDFLVTTAASIGRKNYKWLEYLQ